LNIPLGKKINQETLIKEYVWFVHHVVNVKIQNTDNAITLDQYKQKLNWYNPNEYETKYKNKNIVRFIRVCCDPFYNIDDCAKALDFMSGVTLDFIDFIFYTIEKYKIQEFRTHHLFLSNVKVYIEQGDYQELTQYIDENITSPDF